MPMWHSEGGEGWRIPMALQDWGGGRRGRRRVMGLGLMGN